MARLRLPSRSRIRGRRQISVQGIGEPDLSEGGVLRIANMRWLYRHWILLVIICLVVPNMQANDQEVTRDELLDKVWGYENYPVTRTVDNHIAKLRQKLENRASEPQHIFTIHRVGYKFVA
jgi:hypothetical protein